VKTRFLATALAAFGLGLALVSAPVSAAVTFYSPITAFQDDDLDQFIDNDGDGLISVGDRLTTVFEFADTQGIFSGQGPSAIGPGDELTGVSDITVAAKIATPTPGVFDFVFAPTAGGLLTGGAGSVANIAGAMAVVWLDSSPDLNVINATCGTPAACQALASDGLPNPWLAVGITGADADAYWVSTGQDNPAVVAGLPASTKVAAINFNLEILVDNTGAGLQQLACAPLPGTPCGTGDGLVGVVGSGDILGGQGSPAANGWFARSDVDVQVAVPEPGSLALLGLSLAIAGATVLRRRK
jgi:hypothetical protein